MNRQTLLIIAFAAIMLPLTMWSTKTANDARIEGLKNWATQREAYFKWLDEHPDYVKAHPELWPRLKKPAFKPWLEKHPRLRDAVATVTTATSVVPGPDAPVTSAEAPAAPPRRAEFLAKLAEQKPDDWKIVTPTLTVHLSATGGTVDDIFLEGSDPTKVLREPSFKLVADRDPKMSELGPYHLLKVWDPKVRSFALTSSGVGESLDQVEWLHEEIPGGGHRFTRRLPDGDLVVTKEYLPPVPIKDNAYDDYHFTLRVTVSNTGEQEKRFFYSLLGSAGLIEPTTSSPLPFEAAIGRRDEAGGFSKETRANKDVWKDVKDNKSSLKVQAPSGNKITFFGLAAKQFTCVVLPEEGLPIEAAAAHTLEELAGKKPSAADEKAFASHEPSEVKEIAVAGTRSEFAVSPGKTVTQEYVIYAGPLWKELLENHPVYEKANLGSLVDYPSIIPGVRWLAIFLTKLLLGFHWITRSWGVSIILLTILVRACLHPLMVKQTKSTMKMQSLSPEINKLKEKYQDKDGNMSPEDSRKFQAEQMELWKKHGINPLGCMGPMLLQLPIFYGLWNSLRYAFELRQSSFLWIRDLTEPDAVARLPFTLPMHAMNALCVLPIVMLVVNIIQIRLMPKSQDASQQDQQKIMQWMMPVMGYMFYSIQSGLLLYYITSSLLGMIEQRWIKKTLGVTQPGAPGVPAKV